MTNIEAGSLSAGRGIGSNQQLPQLGINLLDRHFMGGDRSVLHLLCVGEDIAAFLCSLLQQLRSQSAVAQGLIKINDVQTPLAALIFGNKRLMLPAEPMRELLR